MSSGNSGLEGNLMPISYSDRAYICPKQDDLLPYVLQARMSHRAGDVIIDLNRHGTGIST